MRRELSRSGGECPNPIRGYVAGAAHERLSDATKVFNGIPQDLLNKAHCIVIGPGLKQAAPGIDGKFGRGYAVCRQNRATRGGPAAIRLVGGSVGFKIGSSGTDIVMLLLNDRGMRCLLEDEIKLGSESTVAAGPVGRQTSSSTGVRMPAEILSWSRSKGLFAGISLQGPTLQSDDGVNMEFFGGPEPLLAAPGHRRRQDQELTDHNLASACQRPRHAIRSTFVFGSVLLFATTDRITSFDLGRSVS